MNGAESLLRTAAAAGIEVCFANPGTTEMPLVAALDAVPGLRSVLGLFEGVCTGAADGYGRMAGKPALTLLHLGPGFANGIANLHNARRARSPIVNLIGDHASWHLAADAPLNSDVISLAAPVSSWLRRSQGASELAADVAEAIAAASARPGRIATLILPHDAQLEGANGPVTAREIPLPPPASDQSIRDAALRLRRGLPAALFLGGEALGERGLRAAARVAAASGCRLFCETFPARLERGAGLPAVTRFPYFPEQGLAALAPFQLVVLAGARAPVAFFGYPGMPSRLTPLSCETVALATPDQDAPGALEALAETLDAPAAGEVAQAERPLRPAGALTPESMAAAIVAVQPDGAIVVDEGNTSSAAYFALSERVPRHTYLALTGGAIGQGLPCAVGAAIASPGRRVMALEADGSGMYTLQALWTQAREGLEVTTIVCANRSYRILGIEMARAGMKDLGPHAHGLVSLSDPALDWVKLAGGMGVPGARVETAEALTRELERALSEPGPYLIEAML